MASRHYDEPNQSDATLLVSVEDLIHRALGSPDANTVNFKLVQMILHILARQQRMLEQRVEIREDFVAAKPKEKETSESSSSKSPKTPGKKKLGGIKEERETKGKGSDMEKQKADKSTKKDKKAQKEINVAEKQAEKENARDREKSPSPTKGRKRGRMAVTEIHVDQENVLVVERSATTRTESRPRTSIDVVTQSQFALLEAAVNEIRSVALPKPLVLPDNAQLKSNLASGSATLLDTMQAMQVDARVKAAEEAISRMTGILAQLTAASGIEVPEDPKHEDDQAATTTEENAESIKSRPIGPRKSVAIDPKVSEVRIPRTSSVPPLTPKPSQATSSKGSLLSRISSTFIGPGVTHREMEEALKTLREELAKNLDSLTARAISAAENALHTARAVADRLDVALKLDLRISTLYSLVEDYAEQLSGFDSGLTTQMQGFQDQIAQIRTDLQSGLAQLDNVNNNAETAAVLELTERYDELVTELESTAHAHKTLAALQSQLGGEMHSLVECVEMLREQKCDRDEVVDGLRDKADTARLAGLLTEAEFADARADFERRVEACHDKFRRQEAVWMAALRDLTQLTERKAELVELVSAREEAQRLLSELHMRVRTLAQVLAEPQAAMLTRRLAKEAMCGACGTPALMRARDASEGAPPALPALRAPRPEAPEGPCLSDWIGPQPPDVRHVCRRWCGGSHTLVSENVTRGGAPPALPPAAPSLRFTGYGDDGRLYMMEEELKPCIECNVLKTDEHTSALSDGAGDASLEMEPSSHY